MGRAGRLGPRGISSFAVFLLQLVKIFWREKLGQNLPLCKETPVHLCLGRHAVGNRKEANLGNTSKTADGFKKWPENPEVNRDKKNMTEHKRGTHQDPAAAVAPVGYAILDLPELAALSRDILLKIKSQPAQTCRQSWAITARAAAERRT
jgi:hypothetical protein